MCTLNIRQIYYSFVSSQKLCNILKSEKSSIFVTQRQHFLVMVKVRVVKCYVCLSLTTTSQESIVPDVKISNRIGEIT